MRQSRPTSIRRARRRRCYPTKAEEGHFASHVLGRKVPWNREVLQGRRWRNHPPRGHGPTLRGVDENGRTVAWQANAPSLAKASACAFRIVDSWACLRERPPSLFVGDVSFRGHRVSCPLETGSPKLDLLAKVAGGVGE